MGKTRDLFKEIKYMTGSCSSSCVAMQLSTRRVVSEEKDIKKRWKRYTENLYRRDLNINYICNENLYDEPDVLEIEVKEAIRHIYNRKASGCDGILIEFLKAGGDKAIRIMTSSISSSSNICLFT